jgi:hypothetical protein
MIFPFWVILVRGGGAPAATVVIDRLPPHGRIRIRLGPRSASSPPSPSTTQTRSRSMCAAAGCAPARPPGWPRRPGRRGASARGHLSVTTQQQRIGDRKEPQRSAPAPASTPHGPPGQRSRECPAHGVSPTRRVSESCARAPATAGTTLLEGSAQILQEPRNTQAPLDIGSRQTVNARYVRATVARRPDQTPRLASPSRTRS